MQEHPPEQLTRLYGELLVNCKPALTNGKEYCCLAAINGNHWDGGLLFYGRATNGWVVGFNLEELQAGCQQIVEEAFALNRKTICNSDSTLVDDPRCDGDPMHWVHHRRARGRPLAKGSPFWRVVGMVVRKLERIDDDAECWASHVAWSDLYKVSPKRGNPSVGLRVAQGRNCLQICRQEVLHLRPRSVIFLTEIDGERGWLKSFPGLISNEQPSNLPFICGTGKVVTDGYECKAVVAQHPQTRPEAVEANAIVSALLE